MDMQVVPMTTNINSTSGTNNTYTANTQAAASASSQVNFAQTLVEKLNQANKAALGSVVGDSAEVAPLTANAMAEEIQVALQEFMDENGEITDEAGEFIDRLLARLKELIAQMQEQGASEDTRGALIYLADMLAAIGSVDTSAQASTLAQSGVSAAIGSATKNMDDMSDGTQDALHSQIEANVSGGREGIGTGQFEMERENDELSSQKSTDETVTGISASETYIINNSITYDAAQTPTAQQVQEGVGAVDDITAAGANSPLQESTAADTSQVSTSVQPNAAGDFAAAVQDVQTQNAQAQQVDTSSPTQTAQAQQTAEAVQSVQQVQTDITTQTAGEVVAAQQMATPQSEVFQAAGRRENVTPERRVQEVTFPPENAQANSAVEKADELFEKIVVRLNEGEHQNSTQEQQSDYASLLENMRSTQGLRIKSDTSEIKQVLSSIQGGEQENSTETANPAEQQLDQSGANVMAQATPIELKTVSMDTVQQGADSLAPTPLENQIGSEIESRLTTLADGSTEFEMVMNPESLGKVTVKLVARGKEITVSIIAEQAQTATILQRRGENLQAVMRDSGVDLQGYNVEVQPQEQNYQEDQNNRGHQDQQGEQGKNEDERRNQGDLQSEIDFSEFLQSMM